MLEGIGMIADDNYSILQECYPYLARRLVTDSSPRTRVALKEMLYGSASASSLNVSRLVNLAGGMQKFASSTREDGSAAVDEALAILLSKEGNYLQELLLEELARLLEALGRQTVSQIFRTPAGRLATSTLKRQQSIAERLGPAAVFLPFALPARLFSTVEPYLEVKEEDVEALKTARDFLVVTRPFLSSFLRDALSSNQRLDSRSLRALAQDVLPRMQEMGPGASALLARSVMYLSPPFADRDAAGWRRRCENGQGSDLCETARWSRPDSPGPWGAGEGKRIEVSCVVVHSCEILRPGH